jgi:hypothetical protein
VCRSAPLRAHPGWLLSVSRKLGGLVALDLAGVSRALSSVPRPHRVEDQAGA